MHYRMSTAVGVLALTLAAGACNRGATVEQRDNPAATNAARDAERTAALQQQRDQDLSKMNDRIAALERDYQTYQEKRGIRPSGTTGTTATTSLRGDVKNDVDDVKKAVNNLRTTTPENWWERHESVINMVVDEVESDVKRFAGAKALSVTPKNTRVIDASGQPVSKEPFMSRRDKFVADVRARVNVMDKALDNVKAAGRRKTELDDLHARVDKLGDDIDRLKSASAEDWWDLSKARVEEYIERVEKSVARLDDNKR